MASLYDVWTDRDVAIHEALAREGRTEHARNYARHALEGWYAHIQTKPDSWDVPSYDPYRHKPLLRTNGEPWCEACLNSGWVYLGRFKVQRCMCRPDTRKGTWLTKRPTELTVKEKETVQ